MQRKKLTLLLVCWTLALFLCPVSEAGQTPAVTSGTLTVSPQVLEINAFFSGGDLTLTGSVAPSEDIIIEVFGKDTSATFDLKGRIGPFWMTKGNINFEHVPELYLLLLPQGPDWDRNAESAGLGMKQLEMRLTTSASVDVPAGIFSMFVEMKKSEGLYKNVPDAITYSPVKNGSKQFKAVCRLPALIGTGTYDIKATVISNGLPVRQIDGNFSVREIGFVKIVSDMASNRRILYGVAAVVIAIMAGIFMGIVFRQEGGSH